MLQTVYCQIPLQTKPIDLWIIGPQNTVRFLKEQLATVLHCDPNIMNLVAHHVVLRDEQTLGTCNIHEGSQIVMLPKMSSGFWSAY